MRTDADLQPFESCASKFRICLSLELCCSFNRQRIMPFYEMHGQTTAGHQTNVWEIPFFRQMESEKKVAR